MSTNCGLYRFFISVIDRHSNGAAAFQHMKEV
jgi:hypothetical protein